MPYNHVRMMPPAAVPARTDWCQQGRILPQLCQHFFQSSHTVLQLRCIGMTFLSAKLHQRHFHFDTAVNAMQHPVIGRLQTINHFDNLRKRQFLCLFCRLAQFLLRQYQHTLCFFHGTDQHHRPEMLYQFFTQSCHILGITVQSIDNINGTGRIMGQYTFRQCNQAAFVSQSCCTAYLLLRNMLTLTHDLIEQ